MFSAALGLPVEADLLMVARSATTMVRLAFSTLFFVLTGG